MSFLRVDTLKTRDGTFQIDVADLAGSPQVDQLRTDLEADIASLSAETVHKTSATGVALLPEGTSAQRPDPTGLSGLLIRGNTDTKRPEWFDRFNNRWKAFGDASGEVFNYAWHNGTRATITEGRVATDGQQLTYLLYPEICQAIWDGKQHAVTETLWQSDVTRRNAWSTGDGTSWVRVPDLNAVISGKPFYLRGGPDSVNGTSVGDAIRNIAGTFRPASDWGGTTSTAQFSGAFYQTPQAFSNNIGGGSAGSTSYGVGIDASRVVPTADENRVKTAYGVWTVRVFSDITNEGSINAAALAAQLAVTDTHLNTLDNNLGFAIIYPNGGTAAAPANVSINTRYVMTNPFPGSNVIVSAEILTGGAWGPAGFIYAAGGIGVAAHHYGYPSTDSIVITTGGIGLLSTGFNSGSPHTTAVNVTTPLPCRVKVWKVKGNY